MKVLSKVLFMVLVASLAYAVGTDSWVDADGFLQIPTTAISPDIDGTLDDVWKTVPIIKCDTYTGEDPTPEGTVPDDYLDLTTEGRAMWDAGNFYFFGRVIDDEPAVGGDPWMNDSFELYFDGDNSKNDQATGFDANDKQWRWVYMETANSSGTETFAWVDTDYGYNFELMIPAADLAVVMPLVAEQEFGFEAQQNDRDAEARQHLSRWWSTDNNSYQNPSLFGNAVLNGDVTADEVLNVYKTDTPFEIDGDLEDAWLAFPKVPQNTWVTDDGTWDFEALDSYWYDCYLNFRVAWDEMYFYAYVEQADDVNVVNSTDHTSDSVELYWDGDNSKNDATAGYDANDHQFRWITDGINGTLPADGLAAFIVHDAGYFLEVAVPWAALGFEPVEDALFGFEVQTNDNDSGARDHMGRWWSESNSSWNTPQVFGTAVFAPSTAVENEAAQVENYDLAQNYPNPFNPTTTINYAVRARENVRLTVYDMLGHQVATLVNEVKNIGTYEVTFDASNLASGNYFYKLEMGDKVITKKMTLLK